MPKQLKYIKTNAQFNQWMDQQFNKSWVVHLQKTTQGNYNTLTYLGRYIKRPPIGETRIKKYDGKNVTYQYFDHKTKKKYISTIQVFKFIALMISHIPDKGFRVIRYYGWLANQKRKSLLPKVFALLNCFYNVKFTKIKWRKMILKTFNFDPLACYSCKETMLFSGSYYPPPYDIPSFRASKTNTK